MKTNKEKARETIDVIEKGFLVKKSIHPGYLEWLKIKKLYEKKLKTPIRQYFGKYHYNFIKGNMQISLIKIWDGGVMSSGKWVWEIYAREDERLFKDTQKFPTKRVALIMIESYLGS